MTKTKLHSSKKGQKISIELNRRGIRAMLEGLEELDAIRAYDSAKSSGETRVFFEQAVRQS